MRGKPMFGRIGRGAIAVALACFGLSTPALTGVAAADVGPVLDFTVDAGATITYVQPVLEGNPFTPIATESLSGSYRVQRDPRSSQVLRMPAFHLQTPSGRTLDPADSTGMYCPDDQAVCDVEGGLTSHALPGVQDSTYLSFRNSAISVRDLGVLADRASLEPPQRRHRRRRHLPRSADEPRTLRPGRVHQLPCHPRRRGRRAAGRDPHHAARQRHLLDRTTRRRPLRLHRLQRYRARVVRRAGRVGITDRHVDRRHAHLHGDRHRRQRRDDVANPHVQRRRRQRRRRPPPSSRPERAQTLRRGSGSTSILTAATSDPRAMGHAPGR